MKKKGSKILIAAGIIEIIVGVVSILLIRYLLGRGDTVNILSYEVGKDALKGLIILYGVAALRIASGLAGTLLSNKKSVVTIILGILLIVIQGVEILIGDLEVTSIVVDVLFILIPCFYLYGALANYTEEEPKKVKKSKKSK